MYPLRQMVITIGSPPQIGGQEGRWALAKFYGELLGMQVVSEGWLKIAKVRGVFELALDGDGWSDLRPPRWRDPDRPQQIHIDIVAGDPEAAGQAAVASGASLLEEFDDHRVYADPAGHPFCLRPSPLGDLSMGPTISRVMFDCFSPRSLATFYEELFGVRTRLEDSAERVVISLEDERFPDLGFQHAQFVPARWPDPQYPAQLHLDLRFIEGREPAAARAERLGAIPLPKLADTAIFGDPAAHPFCI